MMISSIQEYIDTPLLYNHWYVAGTTEEFTREPVAKTLLERSIVFYRTESGELTALQNRCLHRSYPLSESELDGDNLVCSYHGACYDPDGTLVRIPSQAKAPVPKRSLKKYPVEERGPLVFIWMGDGEPDPARHPELPHIDNPAYKTLHGHYDLDGSYLFMGENLYDLTHFVYLHRKTFNFDESFYDVPTTVFTEPDGTIVSIHAEEDPMRIRMALPPSCSVELEGQDVKQTDRTTAPAPGIFQAHFWIHPVDESDAEATDESIQGYVRHFVTPITKGKSEYWWAYSVNRGVDEDEYFAGMRMFLEMGFSEDVVAVRQMQELLETDTTPVTEMNIAGDKAGKLFRRRVLAWAAEEYGDAVDLAELDEPLGTP